MDRVPVPLGPGRVTAATRPGGKRATVATLRNLPLAALRGERHFRWRGGDVSRIEGLADAVIALAMTLLIVSLEVPDDFDMLLGSFRQLPAFAVCFVLLVLVWYYHHQFHRRFGLENGVVLWLNAALLFLILFYVYPLKFVFTKVFDGLLYGDRTEFSGGVTVMVFYSGGVVGIFGLFAILNAYAYRHRTALELTPVEAMITRATIREHLIHAGVGTLSILLALFVHAALAGLVYFLVGPAQGLHGWWSGRAISRVAAGQAG